MLGQSPSGRVKSFYGIDAILAEVERASGWLHQTSLLETLKTLKLLLTQIRRYQNCISQRIAENGKVVPAINNKSFEDIIPEFSLSGTFSLDYDSVSFFET